MAKGAKIGRGSHVNGNGLIGEGSVLEEGVSLNGNLNLDHATIKRGASLNGNIAISHVEMSGSVGCNGSGTISGNCKPAAASDAVQAAE